tara:strand:+ start:1240 stop:2349 length:1110 start_codon:yes stop_codon:yes gene_type:complete
LRNVASDQLIHLLRLSLLGRAFLLMTKTIAAIALSELSPHPRNKSLYGVTPPEGFDQNLINSLKKSVWPGEIQVTSSNVIISGHRRVEHCLKAGINSAQVWVRKDLPQDPKSAEVLEALLQANLQRNKDEWTLSQELKLWNEVEVLYSRRKASAAGKEAKSSPRLKGSADKSSSKKAEVPAIKKAAARMGLEEGEKKLRQRVQVVQAVEKAIESGQHKEAERVKKALNSSPTKAFRVAHEEGLIERKKAKQSTSQNTKPLPLTPTGQLNDSMKKIIKRERQSSKARLLAAGQLEALRKTLTATWEIAQRERTKLGASVHAKDVEIAEKQIQQDGDPGIRESLEKIETEAELLRKAVRQALYHLHFIDCP